MGRGSVLLCQLTAMLGLFITPLFAEEWPLPAPASVGPLEVKPVRWISNGYNPVWAPDGTFLVFSRLNDGFFRCEADGSREVRLADTEAFCDISPDSTMVLFCQIRTVETERGKQREPCGIGLMKADGFDCRLINEWGSYAEWSPDGRYFACHGGRNPVLPNQPSSIYDRSGELLRRLEHSWATPPFWSPDGRYLAYVGQDAHVYLANGDGTSPQEVGRLDEGQAFMYMWWSPKGHKLLYWRRGGSLFYVRRGAQTIRVSDSVAERGWPPVIWSPDGDRAVVRERRENDQWSVSVISFPATGEPKVLYRQETQGYPAACWEQEGDYLFYKKTNDALWVVTADGKVARSVKASSLLTPGGVLPGTGYLIGTRSVPTDVETAAGRWVRSELCLLNSETEAVTRITPDDLGSKSALPAPTGTGMVSWAGPPVGARHLLLFRVERRT